MKRPMSKQPTTLVAKVASGKLPVWYLDTMTVVRKRNMLPTAPPSPTMRNCFIILFVPCA